MKKILLLLVIATLLVVAVGAKETVVYENDFSSDNLSDFKMYGTMQVVDGALKAVGGGTSAYVSYTLPEEHTGKDYMVDVDYFGHTSMAGLLIGATSDSLRREPAYFSGYTTTFGESSDRVNFSYFNEIGWGGTFIPSTVHIPTKDMHMSVRVYKGAMTLRVSSLDQKELYYQMRYEPGDHEKDLYDTLTSTMGIRQYYADEGYFDNFKVTVIEDDVLPAMNASVTAGGVSFKSSGLTVAGDVVSGRGAMLSEKAYTGEYRVTLSLANKNISRVYFGMTDEKNGYALEFNEVEQYITLFKIKDGEFSILGVKARLIRQGFCDVTVDVHDGIASIYYDNYFQGEDAFALFEFYLDGTDGKIGLWLEDGQAQLLSTGASTVTLDEATYINPINPGADPDCLFYEGTYYLYVYSGNDGTNIFKVYTSPDLVHFTPRNYIFNWDPTIYSNANGKTAWSPNVFYNESDGLFYLFFAAEQIGGDTSRRVYYASSDSPLGPFTHNGPLVAINDVTEIDGHPFVGYDGKTYMSFSRYDDGGTIWFEEVIIKDGVVTAKPETATRVVVSDRAWDTDGAIRLVEGGFVWKHDGYYYLIYATCSYSRHYGEALAISKNPLGPYEKVDYNPILNWNYVIDGPGDALMINSPDGEEVYMIYHRHNVINFADGKRNTCVDLVEFVENPDDPNGPDILVLRGPSSTPQKLPSNKYRYDVNRDGTVNLADAVEVVKQIRSSELYSGAYDVDANGSLGIGDIVAIFEEIK